MEKLRIEAKKQQHSRWHAGNEVLRILYPAVRGETPAAMHTAALIEQLVTYAKVEAARIAADALLTAAKNGRLFDFVRHTYDISLQVSAEAQHIGITLSIRFAAGDAVIFTHTLTMYWNKAEILQLKKLPRSGKRTPRRAKSRSRTRVE